MTSAEQVDLSQQVAKTPLNTNINGNDNNDTSSSSSKQADKKKRHNNKGRNKKKNPNVMNATETGTPKSAIGDPTVQGESSSNAKKPSNKRNNRNQKSNNKNNSTPVNRISKNRAQGRLTEENDALSISQESSNSSKKNSRWKKNRQKLPPGDHDMATLLAHELKTSTYECMICMDVVRPAHHVWTCDCCWAVFHLNCVQTWATRSLKGININLSTRFFFSSKTNAIFQIHPQIRWSLAGAVLVVKIVDQLFQKITYVFAVSNVILKHRDTIHRIVVINYVRDIKHVLMSVFCK